MGQPSHRMNPVIHFSHIDEAGFVNQTVPFQDLYFQEWNILGPRTAAHSVSSQAGTVNSPQTAPATRTPTRLNVRHPKTNVRRTHIDPSMDLLVPPGPRSYSSTSHVDKIVNPIDRMNRSDGPWNSLQMRNSDVISGRNAILCTQENLKQYRQRPSSEHDNTSDSGYHTQPEHSVFSNEPGGDGQALPNDLMLRASNMNVSVSVDTSHSMVRTASEQRSVSQHSSRSGGHRQRINCREPGCSKVSNCISEHKRHMLKHEKTFICKEPDCKRNRKGFSTVNDLERHKKSVHKIGLEKSKSYQCAAANCTHKNKIWPRLDNFKQHLERMHGDEDIFELIRRSEYRSETSSIQQLLSVDPVLLAGIGEVNSSLPSTCDQGFSFQPPVSISMSSFSSGFEVSPRAAPGDLFSSQLGPPASVQGSSNPPTHDRPRVSVDDLSGTSQRRQRPTKVSPTNTNPASQVSLHSPKTSDTIPTLQLSNRPQTKSEQQRQALEKITKADKNYEDTLLRVFGTRQQQDNTHSDSIVLSDDERRHALQAIADLLKEKLKRPNSPKRRSTQGSTSSMAHCDFKDCDFSGRPCDLKKHKKRHQKPYGCTYPKCHKRFGAKSDWKRHENSQHFQLEAFRCDHFNNAGEKCGHHCYHPTKLKEHLADTHKVTSEIQVETFQKRCRIGKNCQGQFWCGFCRDIVPLVKKRNDAWDERFNHIACHFEKDKIPIDDWLCVEENRTKKQIQEDMDRHAFSDEAEMGADSGSPGVDAVQDLWTRMEPEVPPVSAQADSRKEKTPGEGLGRTNLWNCCDCGGGPATYSVHASCPECSHHHCSECSLYLADDNESNYMRFCPS